MISKRRRDLPHWEVEGATYFLTFRLADAMPGGVLAELSYRTEAWLRHHGCAHRREVSRLTPSEPREFRQVISRDEEQWLDSGQGSCVLRQSKHRKPLVETLHHFDGMRYVLDEYVIMPNHVHAILQPMHGWALAKIAATWKQYSSMRINASLQQNGSLWLPESFDHIIRNAAKLEQCRRYIAANPSKAKLTAAEYQLGCGGAIAN